MAISESSKVGRRGTFVIPANLRRRYGIEEGSEIIEDDIDLDRRNSCGSGINIADYEWVDNLATAKRLARQMLYLFHESPRQRSGTGTSNPPRGRPAPRWRG